MGLHEISIANVYISPIFIYAIIALPLTSGLMFFVHHFKLSKFIGHETFFIVALYAIIFSLITLISPI